MYLVPWNHVAWASLTESRIHDSQRVTSFLVADAGQAQHRFQFRRLDNNGGGFRRCSWGRQRKCSSSSGVEGDVAFDFLHHLMDVVVQDWDRYEPLQHRECLFSVVGSPAP